MLDRSCVATADCFIEKERIGVRWKSSSDTVAEGYTQWSLRSIPMYIDGNSERIVVGDEVLKSARGRTKIFDIGAGYPCLTCPSGLCPDRPCAPPNIIARLDSQTSTHDNSITIALINEAIEDLNLREEGEQFFLREITDKYGVQRSTLGRR